MTHKKPLLFFPFRLCRCSIFCYTRLSAGILDLSPATRASRATRHAVKLAGLMAALLLVLAPSAYAIFPFPVASTTAETAAYIIWRTDVAGTSQVNFGLTASYGSSTTKDSTLVTYHAQLISGLTAGTTYHFQVVSVDGSSNTVQSRDYAFTTLSAPSSPLTVGSGKTYSTISACIAAATAGQTCEVYASGKGPSGTGALSPTGYDEKVAVQRGVTVEAHDPVVVAAWSLSANVPGATIEGFEVSTTAFSDFSSCAPQVPAFVTSTSPNLTISNNYVHNMYAGVFLREANLGQKSDFLQVLNNIMTYVFMTNTNPPYSHPCDTTTGDTGHGGISEFGDHCLYDGNFFSEADHLTYDSGSYDVFRRNVLFHTYAADWGSNPTFDHVDYFHPSAVTSSGGAHTIHNILENNQEFDTDAANEHFLLAESCNDQSASQIATGDGSTKTFSGTLSLTNADGTDSAIAVFSVALVVNVSNNGCSGSSQGGNATVAAADDGFGHLVNPPGFSGVSSGTINYSTGAYSVTFSGAPANGAPITAYWSLLAFSTHDTIIRFNMVNFQGSGFVGTGQGGTPGLRAYNNTVYHNGFQGTSSNAGQPASNYSGQTAASAHWADLNNLFDDAGDFHMNPPWGQQNNFSPPGVTPGFGLVFGSACDPTPGCSYGASTRTAPGMVIGLNPNFTNVAGFDFTLLAGSPALNAGTFLTTVASADSGSGTSLIVSDAGFFQDGYEIPSVNGDCIAVTTVTNHVCITAVNYQTNTLTLASSITRSVGDHIWLYSDSTGRVVLGTAPNIGATFTGTTLQPAMTLTAVPH